MTSFTITPLSASQLQAFPSSASGASQPNTDPSSWSVNSTFTNPSDPIASNFRIDASASDEAAAIASDHGDFEIGQASPTRVASPVSGGANVFAEMLEQSTQALNKAQDSERRVISGQGSILDMSVDRARADAMLGLVATGSSRVASALTTFANMAV